MSLTTTKALLIINAKKGWTAEARAKAVATRKAKKKAKSGFKGSVGDALSSLMK